MTKNKNTKICTTKTKFINLCLFLVKCSQMPNNLLNFKVNHFFHNLNVDINSNFSEIQTNNILYSNTCLLMKTFLNEQSKLLIKENVHSELQILFYTFLIGFQRDSYSFLYEKIQLSKKLKLILEEVLKCLQTEKSYYFSCQTLENILGKNNKNVFYSEIYKTFDELIIIVNNELVKNVDIDIEDLNTVIKTINLQLKVNKLKQLEMPSIKWGKIKTNITTFISLNKPFDIFSIGKHFTPLDICIHLKDILKKDFECFRPLLENNMKIQNTSHAKYLFVAIKYSEQIKEVEKACNIMITNENNEVLWLKTLKNLKNFLKESYSKTLGVNDDLNIKNLQNIGSSYDYMKSFIIETKWNDIFLELNNYIFSKEKNNKTKDKYKTIKMILKSNINNDSYFNTINDIVFRVNEIVKRGYMAIKMFILFKYENNAIIPDITSFDFFSMVIRSITINDPKGNNIGGDNKKLLEELENFYDAHLKTIFGDKLNAVGLSNILNAEKIKMKTCYTNNVSLNYHKYLTSYLTSIFGNISHNEFVKLESKKEKGNFKKKLSCQVKFFISYISDKNNVNKNFVYNNDYKEFVDKNINSFASTNIHKNGLIYDVKQNPNKYFEKMMFMNKSLEVIERKMFTCFPLRQSLVPSCIDIDTTTLITLFLNGKNNNNEIEKEKGITQLLKNNLGCFYKKIWSEIFEIKNFKYNSQYEFSNRIETNGFEIIVYFVDKNLDGVEMYINDSNDDKFSYIDDICKDEASENVKKEFKNMLEIYTVLFVDPGKNPDLLFICNYEKNVKNTKYFKYTTKQRLHEMGTMKNRKLLRCLKKDNNIQKQEEKLKNVNSKTCELIEFEKYAIIKTAVDKIISPFYKREIFRKLNFRAYIGKQRSESKLVNNIKRIYGTNNKEILLVYGDWSRRSQMRGCISTPCIGLKRTLAKYFKIKNIDEFRTSCLDNNTFEENVNAVIIKNERNRKLHSVLVSKIKTTENGKDLLRFQNRNRNSVLNMRNIFGYYLSEGKRHPKFERNKNPIEVFKRVVN